jgi:hypothetical protein
MESITKGVVALLVGIAFDRGWLKSLDASVFSFVPEYADLRSPDKDKITVRHLLSMTSGLDWPERAISVNNPENIVRRGYNASDPYRFVLERSVEASPGTVWNYNGGGVWLLGLILRKVSGQPLDGFAKDALFEPLGIEEWEWGRFPNRDPSTSGGLHLRPRDLAKLGQLVLDNGVWQGRQIVSADWINQMTARQSPPGFSFGSLRSYGYLWWQGRSSIDNHDIDWIGALGRGAHAALGRRSHRRPLWRIKWRCAFPQREPRWRHGAEFIRLAGSARALKGCETFPCIGSAHGVVATNVKSAEGRQRQRGSPGSCPQSAQSRRPQALRRRPANHPFRPFNSPYREGQLWV